MVMIRECRYMTPTVTTPGGTTQEDGFWFCIYQEVRGGADSYVGVHDPVRGGGRPQTVKNVGQAVRVEIRKKSDADCAGGIASKTDYPVIIATGNKILPELDFQIGDGSQSLSLSRMYDKSDGRVGVFGGRWSSNIELGLTFEYGSVQCVSSLTSLQTCNPGGVALSKIYTRRADGGVYPFTLQGGIWKASNEAVIAADGSGWLLTLPDGAKEKYDAYGRPVRIADERNIGLTYSYSSDKLSSISHTSGRSISFTWNGSKIATVTWPGGATYTYDYNSSGYLNSVTYPGGLGVRSYHYEDSAQPGGLTGISINGERYTRYAYQADGRVLYSGLESGIERSNFTYGTDGNGFEYTDVTNPLGQTTRHLLAGTGSSKRIWQRSRPASGTCSAGASNIEYDVNGNPISVVDGYGVKKTFSYDSLGQPTEEVDGIGAGNEVDQQKITQYVWDTTNKRRLNQIKVFGSTTSQPLKTTTYTYYPDGDIRARLLKSVAVTNHGGGTIGTLATNYDYTLHPSGMLATMSVDGPLTGTGDKITYTYDTAGNLLTVTNSLGHAEVYSNYTALGQPGRITSANGAVVDYTYNARGQLLTEARTVNGVPQVTTSVYDNRGRLVSVSPRSGLTTRYTYDNFDRLLKISRTRPSESYPAYVGAVYPPNSSCPNCGPGTPTSPPKVAGKVAGISSEGVITGGVCLAAPATSASVAVFLGGPMGYTGTPAGQYSASLPSSSSTTTYCSSLGATKSLDFSVALTPAMRQHFGGREVYVYGVSSLGNASLKFAGSGGASGILVPPLPSPPSEFIRYTYNLLGQVTQIDTGLEKGSTVVESHATQYIDYDEGGFVSKRRGSNGQSLTYHYNANGDVQQVADNLNHITSFTYDRLRRISGVIDAGNGESLMSYNALGLIALVRDTRNNSTTYIYDGLGNVLTQVSPDTGMTTFSYNAQGQRTQIQRADLSTIEYTHDALGRLNTVSAGGQTRTLIYDNCTNGKGMLCSATKTGGTATTTNFGYTPWGQLATRQDIKDGATDTTTYGYDDLDHLANINYPSGVSVEYVYDGLHLRVINASIGGSSFRVAAPSYERAFGPATYIEFGRGAGFEGGALWTQRNFDASDRLVGISTSTASGPLQSLTYALDAADRITAITNGVDSARTEQYQYDPLSRLTRAELAGGNVAAYGYDANGNRTTASNSSPANSISYTIAGSSNRLTHSVAGGYVQPYDYNLNGDIVSFKDVAGIANTLTYDPFGRLMSHDKLGTTTAYTVNALDQRVAKSNASSSSRYVYAGFNQMLAEYTNGQWSSYIWLGNAPVALIRNNSIYYIHNDHLGRPESVSGVDVNNNPSIVWKANNTAFGRTVVSDTIGGLNFGFPGQYYDQESGIWHNGYREYLAEAGRYLQSDPVGLGGGMNTYAYVGGNPVNLVDPLGLRALTGCEMKILGNYYPQDVLKGIDVQQGMPWFVLGNMIGITFGSNVYVAKDRENTPAFIGLLAHEIGHTIQQDVHGAVFWASYGAQSVAGLLSGKGVNGSHDSISFEQRSDQVERQVLADMKAAGNDPCGCPK